MATTSVGLVGLVHLGLGGLGGIENYRRRRQDGRGSTSIMAAAAAAAARNGQIRDLGHEMRNVKYFRKFQNFHFSGIRSGSARKLMTHFRHYQHRRHARIGGEMKAAVSRLLVQWLAWWVLNLMVVSSNPAAGRL